MVMMNGHCSKCPDYHKPTATRTDCELATCNTSEIILKDGTCKACKYSRPSPDYKECVVPECDPNE